MADKLVYGVHFDQINQQWVEVEAEDKEQAMLKAQEKWLKMNTPHIDAVLPPDGPEESPYK